MSIFYTLLICILGMFAFCGLLLCGTIDFKHKAITTIKNTIIVALIMFDFLIISGAIENMI